MKAIGSSNFWNLRVGSEPFPTDSPLYACLPVRLHRQEPSFIGGDYPITTLPVPDVLVTLGLEGIPTELRESRCVQRLE